MAYSGSGGMRAVVANDTLHFCVLMVSLPLVFYFGTEAIGGIDKLYFYSSANFSNNIPYSSIALVFLSFFFGETLVPPYVQRLLIGKTVQHTIKGNLASGMLSVPFFFMIGLIGIIAIAMNPKLNPNLALPYVVLEAMPIGLKGLAIAGMMAIILSSADSFLNAASVSITHDVLTPILPRLTEPQKLLISKYSTYFVAISGLLFTLSLESAIDILLEAYMFWTPVVLVPFVAGVMGINRPKKAFLYSASAGIAVVALIRFLSLKHSAYFEVSIWGILANLIVFFGYREIPNTARKVV
jgi:SSS family solute:Na+ symporter